MKAFTNNEYEFLEDKNILILRHYLVIRTQASQKTLYEKVLKELRDFIAFYNYPNVLVDGCSVEMDFSAESLIERPNIWKILVIDKNINIKIALLLDKIEAPTQIKINKFQSYGFNLSLFMDYNKAMEWLLE
jgi:hypothetical protein